MPEAAVAEAVEAEASEVAPIEAPAQVSVYDRLTYAAKIAPPNSPFFDKTWVAYYGRPDVPMLGILGEYSIDALVPRLKAQAAAYDEANGPDLGVMPAFHLIYGMAMSRAGADDSYLSYLPDDVVMEYINRAEEEGFGVILDVQIGALSPLDAITPAFPFLKYANVHLALDPEFAMTSPGQTIPGQPAGTITAGQINQVENSMSNYMQALGIKDHRMLIVHQFLPWMIDATDPIYFYNGVDFLVCADGFGPPWPKISKYNVFMDETIPFTGFKLFYGWDEPLMTEQQALGVDSYPGVGAIEVTPNLIIYQ